MKLVFIYVSLVFASLYSFPVMGVLLCYHKFHLCSAHEEWCAVAFFFNTTSFTFAIGTFPILGPVYMEMGDPR